MDPSQFPSVAHGPACACTHPRVSHVGIHPLFRTRVADLGCNECDRCYRYTPTEAIDHEFEDSERDQIRARERRGVEIHRNINIFAAVGVVAGLLVSLFWNLVAGIALMVLAAVIAATSLLVMSFTAWRRGDLGSIDFALAAATAVGLFGLLVGLFTRASDAVLAVPVLMVGTSALIVLWRRKQDLLRTKHSLQLVIDDLAENSGLEDSD